MLKQITVTGYDAWQSRAVLFSTTEAAFTPTSFLRPINRSLIKRKSPPKTTAKKMGSYSDKKLSINSFDSIRFDWLPYINAYVHPIHKMCGIVDPIPDSIVFVWFAVASSLLLEDG